MLVESRDAPKAPPRRYRPRRDKTSPMGEEIRQSWLEEYIKADNRPAKQKILEGARAEMDKFCPGTFTSLTDKNQLMHWMNNGRGVARRLAEKRALMEAHVIDEPIHQHSTPSLLVVDCDEPWDGEYVDVGIYLGQDRDDEFDLWW